MALPFAEATQTAYEQQDVEALRSLYERADSVEDSLLVRYRLYPLTEDEALLRDLPTALPEGNSRALALLSALWAYRAGEASWVGAIRCGRRSAGLLEDAKAHDPDDPFVLLVEGQSLLFRPAIAGQDASAAVETFTTLVDRLDEHTQSGISVTEARIWRWLALRKAGRRRAAQALSTELRQQPIAALYREFLEEPPQI